MKKTKLVVTLAVLALSAIPLMAQNIDDYSEELKALLRSDIQAQQNTESETVKANLEAIKNVNDQYNTFLDIMENSKGLTRQQVDIKLLPNLENLGKAVQAIKNESIRNAYRKLINSVKYNFAYRGKELSLYEIYLHHGNEVSKGTEFLIFTEIAHPTITIDNKVIKALNTQHNKFINFTKNSDGPTDSIIAQTILMQLDDLGIELNKLEEGSFKDSYIETLHTIKYHFAYNNQVYTLEELFNFADSKYTGSIYYDGLQGIKTLFKNTKVSFNGRFWNDPDVKAVLEGFQNNANAGK